MVLQNAVQGAAQILPLCWHCLRDGLKVVTFRANGLVTTLALLRQHSRKCPQNTLSSYRVKRIWSDTKTPTSCVTFGGGTEVRAVYLLRLAATCSSFSSCTSICVQIPQDARSSAVSQPGVALWDQSLRVVVSARNIPQHRNPRY